MAHNIFCDISNESAINLGELAPAEFADFHTAVVEAVNAGLRMSAFFGLPSGQNLQLIAVLADDSQGTLKLASTAVGDSYHSLTPACPQAHWFEREIAEQWGVVPKGHPWMKPIRFHHSYRPPKDAWNRGDSADIPCGLTEFFQVQGDEMHEVAVGPVHAGIIEPGHFRFQCHGENVHHLEISLGYQHRGIERAIAAGCNAKRIVHFMETAAGDTTIGHVTAHCQLVEALSGTYIPPRAMAIRAIALELERIANHIGDLGALAGDVGYLPTMSFCGRIRGDALNATAVLCGNRFGRGLVRPGGVAYDIDAAMIDQLRQKLAEILKDTTGAVNLLWQSPSVTARFEGTGSVSMQACNEMGLVGPAARSCGADRDVRKDLPFGLYRFAHIPSATWDSGDVFARAQVRVLEIQRSVAFIDEQLASLPTGLIRCEVGGVDGTKLGLCLVEGWRGEICHVAIADGLTWRRYKIVDPSFHNWFGLAYALRGQQVSDFPLCNKSFNLSYCGHDL